MISIILGLIVLCVNVLAPLVDIEIIAHLIVMFVVVLAALVDNDDD